MKEPEGEPAPLQAGAGSGRVAVPGRADRLVGPQLAQGWKVSFPATNGARSVLYSTVAAIFDRSGVGFEQTTDGISSLSVTPLP